MNRGFCANCLREEWANYCACVCARGDTSLPEASRTFSATDEAKEGRSLLMRRLLKEAMGEIEHEMRSHHKSL